jgi:Na+/H+ antiporter NhaC
MGRASAFTSTLRRAGHPSLHAGKRGAEMLPLLLILLLLVLLFGGLGVFVAKVFLFAALVALVLTLFSGGAYFRRR